MKHTKLIALVLMLLITVCSLLCGCDSGSELQSTPRGEHGSESKPDDKDEPLDPALCEHEATRQIVITEADGFDDGEAKLICMLCQARLGNIVLPRIESSGLEYKVNDDGVTCTVTGMGSCTDEDLCIPRSINGYTVTDIGIDAFQLIGNDDRYIKRLYVPETVKSVGSMAFYGQDKLKKVYISDGVEWFGHSVFSGCGALADVRLPNGILVISAGMFSGCKSLKNVNIPDSVVSIYDSAFEDCAALSSIELPGSLEFIGSMAFYEAGLIRIKIEEGLRYIGNSAFEGCIWLTSAELPDSVESVGGSLFARCRRLSSVNIPKGLEKLERGMFYNCTSLKTVTLPKGIECIGEGVFEACGSLEQLIIPDTVMYIGEGFIQGCDALAFNEYENGLYLGSDDAPYTVLVSVLDKSASSFRLHEGTRVICGQALKECKGLKSITLSEGLIGVGTSLFSDTSELEYNLYNNGKYLGSEENPYFMLVSFDDSSTTVAEIHPSTRVLGERSLAGYDRLRQIILPEGLVSINAYAFQGRVRLVSIELPSGLRYLGYSAFAGCEGLKSLKVPGSVEYIGDDAFEHCYSLSSIEFLEGITLFRDWFFWTPVKTVTLPSSVSTVISLPVEGMGAGKRLETVIFGGTVADWDAATVYGLEKKDNVLAKVTVKCSDGEVLFGTGWDSEE